MAFYAFSKLINFFLFILTGLIFHVYVVIKRVKVTGGFKYAVS